eukprot:7028265-Ditylum_brightwellii.AAC.1
MVQLPDTAHRNTLGMKDNANNNTTNQIHWQICGRKYRGHLITDTNNIGTTYSCQKCRSAVANSQESNIYLTENITNLTDQLSGKDRNIYEL